MKKIILIALSLCFSLSMVFSKVPKDKSFHNNAAYVELGGNSLLYSINLEQLFRLNKSLIFALGIGTEWLTDLSIDYTNFHHALCLIPHGNLLFGSKSHYLETGLSFITVYGKGGFIPSARIGYRFQPKNGSFLFRIGYTPFFVTRKIEYGGISIGYCF